MVFLLESIIKPICILFSRKRIAEKLRGAECRRGFPGLGNLEEDRAETYPGGPGQRGLLQWEPDNPLRQKLIDCRCQTSDEVAVWVAMAAKKSGPSGRSGQGGQTSSKASPSTGSTKSIMSSNSYPEFVTNAVLVLLTAACSLLDRQVERLAQDFENEGGFSERLYRVRSVRRRRN